MNADAFIAQGLQPGASPKCANIQKRSEVGKIPAWPDGFPNRMFYFFSVFEDILRLKEAGYPTTMSKQQGIQQ